MGALSDLPDSPVRQLPRPPQRVVQRLGADTIAELVAAYEAGTPSTRLTQQYRMGKGSILRLLRDRGVVIRRRGRHDPVQIDEAIAR